MFIDEAQIYIKAGKGGDGAVSFRREKFIPKGGPDGGDGGDGGSVIARGDRNLHDLSQFNRQKNFLAQNGQSGMGQKKSGKKAEDLILHFPIGTQLFSRGELIADITQDGKEIVLAKGGSGGWGNQHFATSIKQTPKWSKQGLKGESKKLGLELKSIADVGLVGLPNSGKSTLLSVLSSAKPKIADYPFTTLEPNFGVLKLLDKNIIIADIPGLIEGASMGRGLGDKFLKHIERTKILVHLIDSNADDPLKDYGMIRKELELFSKKLTKKKEIVALNKTDTISLEQLSEIKKEFSKKKIDIIPISAAAQNNLEELIQEIKRKTKFS